MEISQNNFQGNMKNKYREKMKKQLFLKNDFQKCELEMTEI